jgi:hypothetical protein
MQIVPLVGHSHSLDDVESMAALLWKMVYVNMLRCRTLAALYEYMSIR